MAEHSDYMRGYLDGKLQAYELAKDMLIGGIPYHAMIDSLERMLETIKELRYPEEEK